MITLMKPQQFDEVFRLMEISFPAAERRPYEGQKALLEDPLYRIYILQEDPQQAIEAFIAAWKCGGFVFIEHFAVDPALRGQGIGGAFLRKFIRDRRKMVCLEVELPDTEMARRRIGFYERNGLYLNHQPYVQPAIAPGQPPVPLLLMTSHHTVAGDDFEAIRRRLLETVYRTSPPVEP